MESYCYDVTGVTKIERWDYQVMKKFGYDAWPFRHNSRMWPTDRQRKYISLASLHALRHAVTTKIWPRFSLVYTWSIMIAKIAGYIPDSCQCSLQWGGTWSMPEWRSARRQLVYSQRDRAPTDQMPQTESRSSWSPHTPAGRLRPGWPRGRSVAGPLVGVWNSRNDR